MRTNPVDLFKKTLIVSGLVLPVIFAGCGKKNPIPPPVASVYGVASIVNDVDIKYDGTLTNVNSAKLTITKEDGTPILSETVSGQNFSKTYKYTDNPNFIEGKFKLSLSATDTAESNSSITIPDLPATATIAGSTDINAYGSATLNPVLNDKNPDQNPVTLNSVKSVEGNTQPTIVGTGIYINTIKTASAIGPYQIAVELKNSKGGIDKIIISGNIVRVCL